MQTSVSMIPLTDWKRWIWPSNWPHRCPSKYSEIHFSIWNKTQGHTDQEQNQQNTHFTAVLLVLSLDSSQTPPLLPQPSPTPKQTSTHANKQAGKQTVRAHTNCAYQGPGMTESVPAVLSPGKPSQDKPDGRLPGPGQELQ